MSLPLTDDQKREALLLVESMIPKHLIDEWLRKNNYETLDIMINDLSQIPDKIFKKLFLYTLSMDRKIRHLENMYNRNSYEFNPDDPFNKL